MLVRDSSSEIQAQALSPHPCLLPASREGARLVPGQPPSLQWTVTCPAALASQSLWW
jgi:hypothetical protein